MNSIMESYYSIFEMYQDLRRQLMDLLDDDDLGFRPGDANPTLGTLCREIGETQVSYIKSFTTFSHDFSYRHPEPGIEKSVVHLTDWFETLDGELKAVVAALTEEELKMRIVDRGGGFTLPPRIQLEVYKEALLIFYGKASVYLRALGKPLTEQWGHWIG